MHRSSPVDSSRASIPARLDPPAVEGRPRYRGIWVSDAHLGTSECQADRLLDFLRRHDSEVLYLVGDMIDGWSLEKSWYWTDEQTLVVKEILRKSRNGTRVTYVCGNHDEFLREYVGLGFGGIELVDEAVHVGADGRRFLVLHGDQFDGCVRDTLWLALLGDHVYRVGRLIDAAISALRRCFGRGEVSFAASVKARIKSAVSYVDKFERAIAAETRRRGFTGVICGHVHEAGLREIDGVLYCNDGDWVEACTALVENHDGSLELVSWARAPRGGQAGARMPA